jgi:hypothetical protein
MVRAAARRRLPLPPLTRRPEWAGGSGSRVRHGARRQGPSADRRSDAPGGRLSRDDPRSHLGGRRSGRRDRGVPRPLDGDEILALERLESDGFADRRRVGYRRRVSNADGRFLVEQQAYLSEREGRIAWMRVLCSGYRPFAPCWRTATETRPPRRAFSARGFPALAVQIGRGGAVRGRGAAAPEAAAAVGAMTAACIRRIPPLL